jgi:hypothetical protein
MRHDIVLNEIVEVFRTRPILVRGLLDRLITHDRQRNTDYVAALRIYLDSFGDMRSAAKLLTEGGLSDIAYRDLLDRWSSKQVVEMVSCVGFHEDIGLALDGGAGVAYVTDLAGRIHVVPISVSAKGSNGARVLADLHEPLTGLAGLKASEL